MSQDHGPRDEPRPHSGILRVQGFAPTPVVPTLHPPGVSDSFRRALDEHNDRDWSAWPRDPHDPTWMVRPTPVQQVRRITDSADDLREARGTLMPVAIFLSLGVGIIAGLFIGRYFWH